MIKNLKASFSPRKSPLSILFMTMIYSFVATGVLHISFLSQQDKNNHPPILYEYKEAKTSSLNQNVAHSNRFSNDTQLYIQRGLNIINAYSGQEMAAWVYGGQKKVNSGESRSKFWKQEPNDHKILNDPNKDAIKLSPNDTIWCLIEKIPEFVSDFLPHINTTFVLITSSFHAPTNPQLLNFDIDALSSNIKNNDYLLHWFAVNPGLFTGGSRTELHEKVSPFPLGLKPYLGKAKYRNPIPHYRKAFLRTMNYTERNKTNPIFVSYYRNTSSDRNGIPKGENLDYDVYLEEISKSSYVISPNGDRPDCHRHYEAIGLGAIPITQLHPLVYPHFEEGSVIYNNSNWNVTDLIEDNLSFPAPKINRNMIFEEYWMEYVERVVGRPLKWWDVIKGNSSMLDEFALLNQSKLDENMLALK